MKFIVTFLAVFFGIAGVTALLVVEQAAPTRGFVSNLVDDGMESAARDTAEEAVASVRELVGLTDDTDNPPALTPEPTTPAAPPAVQATLDADAEDAPVLAGQASPAYEIGATGGIGVSLRSDCRDDARIDGGFDEGDAVTIVSRGTEACAGWSLVSGGVPAATTWVRDDYLVERAATQTAHPPSAGGATHFIGATGGIGVSLRSACADEARVDGGFDEGDAVIIDSRGSAECAGWSLVSGGVPTQTTWVRDGYLVTSAPAPQVAPPPNPQPAPVVPAPTATPPPPPAPTPTPQPTSTPAPTPVADAPAVWFGGVSGEPGDVVSAWIGGTECASTSAYDRDGEAFFYLSVPAGAACGPTTGAAVTFRVNGSTVAETFTWEPGSSAQIALNP